jgi:diguanylate cyclase (GGDEF)-like protein
MSIARPIEVESRRILLVDDTEAIHRDYKKSLGTDGSVGSTTQQLALMASDLFGDSRPVHRVRPRFDVESAMQGDEAVALAKRAEREGRPFALAFVDMRMPPGMTGLETIEKLWEITPDMQCVICTAFSDYSWQELIDRIGARDNLLLLRKPFDRIEVLQLATAMTEKWRLGRDVNRRVVGLEAAVEERTRELRRAAMTDKLTGLPNRSFMNDRLSDAVFDAQNDPQKKFAVLYLDFDRFKVINDSLGHEVGDQLLVSVARRILAAIRRTDVLSAGQGTAARLGGDEFVILLTNLVDSADARKVAQRILDVLLPPHEIGGHLIHRTASIGVTTSDFGYDRTEDVVRDADTAMYRAKMNGRARIVVFNPAMHREALQRLKLETGVRRAIDRDEFEIYLQPIIRIKDHTIVGFEALSRWRDPERGFIAPTEFIPLAEETGLIIALGHMMMKKAFVVAARWRAVLGDRTPYITVNLSPKQMMESDLLGRIDRELAESGASPENIHLEVTETYLMTDTDGAIRTLRKIRDRGFGLYIDDFGTGYSSLSALQKFPFTGMKIDRSFLVNSETVKNYGVVLNAMTTLAHNLGLTVIAEGVENTNQLAMLEGVACDSAQGFYFARPMPVDDAEAFLEEHGLLVRQSR